MIPQLKELSSEYHVDGAWVDGECWAVEPDYSESAINAWKKESGHSEIPRTPKDQFFSEYIEFTRSLFRAHLKKYVDAIHEFDPKFQITSNWAYSSLMPEKVDVNVDFLSGDVTPQNGVFRSAFEARCLAPQGKPWDLMAWGFSWNGGKMPMSFKSAIQLKQEAAQIMAMGGGVQFYYQQNKDLSLKPWLANILTDIGSFCRERQAFCHKAMAIPQIALLYPSQSYENNWITPYSGSTDKLQGTLYALLDNQLPVEILMEHNLSGKMSQYPLIVIPECDYIAPSMLTELRAYLENGGNLLIIGPETARIFARELDIKDAKKTEEQTLFISADNRLGTINSPSLDMEMGAESKILSHFYNASDYSYLEKNIASSTRKVGKGKISAIYFNAGTAYNQYKTPLIRDFVAEAIDQLSPELILKVTGSHLVHVTANKLNDKTMINLINVAGEHTNQTAIAYDQVPELKEITVSIKTAVKPSKILLQPEGKFLDFTFSDGKSIVKIPNLKLHSILEITEK
jgi:hypothetical protein